MNVTRIYHLRTRTNRDTSPDMKGGATVVVNGNNKQPGFVTMSVAICSPRDVFCKKVGRQQCLDQLDAEENGKNVFTLPLRDLPAMLGSIHRRIFKSVKVPPLYVDFTPRILDFLPKE